MDGLSSKKPAGTTAFVLIRKDIVANYGSKKQTQLRIIKTSLVVCNENPGTGKYKIRNMLKVFIDHQLYAFACFITPFMWFAVVDAGFRVISVSDKFLKDKLSS